MKKIPLITLFILLILITAACYSDAVNDGKANKKGEVEINEFKTKHIFSLEDIQKPFSGPELNLKPQVEANYPKLNGVKAKAYELLDGMVYIHVFKNNGELKKGINEIEEAYKIEKWGLKVYEVNNMLFVYEPAYATQELVKAKDAEMKKAIREMINAKK